MRRTLKRLLLIFMVSGSVYIALELTKYLIKRSSSMPSENFISDLNVNTPNDIPEANNLPDILNKEYFRWKPNNKCAKLPRRNEIVINNIYWQVLKSKNSGNGGNRGNYYLFGAYFDSRGPCIKILAMLTGNPSELFCNIWFNKGIEPQTIKATFHYIWNKSWKRKLYLFNPYLFSCKLSDDFLLNEQGNLPIVPKAVSLLEEPCQKPSNLIKVNYFNKNERKKDFMVCVKGLDFPEDISYKLIEWIELIRLLGADMIHFYILNVHKNVAKVLDHYKQVGWIIIEGLSIPGPKGYKNRPQQKRHQLISINDCFYKHREEYKYIVLLDIDEIIMPTNGNWKDLIQKLENDNVTSTFSVQNVDFLDLDGNHTESWPFGGSLDDAFLNNNIPGHIHMLQHVYRVKDITQPKLFIKGFHNSSDVVTLHNDFPIECITNQCFETKIDENDAKLAHYRSCQGQGDKCQELKRNYIRDDTIWRYKDVLLNNIANSVRKINLLV